VLTREDFTGVLRNAIAGLGFDQDAAMVTFPIELFLVDSDISPVEARFEEFVQGLTAWEPAVKTPGLVRPPGPRVEGATHAEAAARMNQLFLEKLWGDGLPLVPPDQATVAWVLQGTDRDPADVVGQVLPRGGIATVETLAVTLAMAGGRPEYLPVLIAAMEAMLDPAMEHDKWQATSASTYPVVIVNGPVREQIRLNTGFGLLGPDPRHPAGASIGRALRLLQQNVGGALPGTGTMAVFGAMRYTNAVFGEDEEGLPPGWAPLAAERYGRAADVSSVTVYPATGATNILRRGVGKETLEEEARASLLRIAGYLRSPNAHYIWGWSQGTPGAVLIPRVVARQLAEQGWSKASVREFLWEHSAIPLAELRETEIVRWMEQSTDPAIMAGLKDPWPIAREPEGILLAVAGGGHPTHAFWMQAMAPAVANREVQLPRAWERLIAARAG